MAVADAIIKFRCDLDFIDLILFKAILGNPETVVETEDVVG